MIGEAVSSPDDGRGPMRRLLGESGDMTGSAFEKTTAEGEFVLPGSGPCERVIVTFYHPGGAQAIELREGEPLEVGRDPRADLRLDVESLSRKHARFVLEKGAIWVEDLGSRNGTLIQGERIGRASLEAGTAVSLGGVVAFVQRLPLGAKKVSYDGKAIVTSSATAAMWQEVQRVAPTDLPVLILGETGVGKEVVAAALHEASTRNNQPFHAINCGAIPESLLTSVLFGHEKGAFSGASQTNKGVFEQADGGTVLLDEVGELSASTQAALLRVIETKRITRLGSQREIQLDTRILAATHRDLERMVEQGSFRQDLLFRLNTFVIKVPPLRERLDELERLAEHFIAAASARFRSAPKPIAPDALACLRRYPWPGNLRELRNILERALVLSRGPVISLDDLPDPIRRGVEVRPPTIPPAGMDPRSTLPTVPATEGEGYKDLMREYEIQVINKTLQQTGGNRAQAAKLLNMPLRTLAHKIKLYKGRIG
jgi:two-component system response regulator AtoC